MLMCISFFFYCDGIWLCDKTRMWFIDSLTLTDLCYTPESIAGDCRSIYDCPSVLAQFQGRLTRRTTNYLRSLQCENGIGQYPHVCCAQFNNFEQPNPSNNWQLNRSNGNSNGRRRSSGGGQSLPGPGSCGLTSLAHRIYGGDDTQLDDYPWMALLEYQNRKCSQFIHTFCYSFAISFFAPIHFFFWIGRKNCIHF